MAKPEVYISIDIETDGPVPELYSMLSIGAVPYYRSAPGEDYVEGTSFYGTMFPLPDAIQHHDTMEWWKTQPEAYLEVQKDRRHPLEVITDFGDWLGIMGDFGKLVPVAWPASFDYGFVNWYMHQFYGENPLGFACADIRSYANGLFNTAGYYEKITEGNLYEVFDINLEGLQGHVAVDDARRQGRLWMALINYAKERSNG